MTKRVKGKNVKEGKEGRRERVAKGRIGEEEGKGRKWKEAGGGGDGYFILAVEVEKYYLVNKFSKN